MSKITRMFDAFDEFSWTAINEAFGQRPGGYRLRMRTADLSTWQPIPRLMAKDPEGVLYIGQSTMITSRVSGLRGGMWGAYGFRGDGGRVYSDPKKHQVGKAMTSAFVAATDQRRFVIEITGYATNTDVPDGFDPEQAEASLVRKYVDKFGEPPPFNASWNRFRPTDSVEE